MGNYVGKICPICKKDIKEKDNVKVCVSCGIPYHGECWEENNGCTTPDCPENNQNISSNDINNDILPDNAEDSSKDINIISENSTASTLQTNSTDNAPGNNEGNIPKQDNAGINEQYFCPKCGTQLGEQELFCRKCGTLKAEYKSNICSNCGMILQQGQSFCPRCGHKVGLAPNSNINSAIPQFNDNIENTNKKKKTPIIIGAASVVIVIIAAVLIFKLFLNPERFLAAGNYERAYLVASSEQKDDILKENLIAYICKDIPDVLKDPSSFHLQKVWYDEEDQNIVLNIVANNSYGSPVSNYWYYSYDDEDLEYSRITTFSDFDEEKTYSWDNYSEKLEKALKNVYKKSAALVISESENAISQESIDNINHLFENNLLNDVVLLSENQ